MSEKALDLVRGRIGADRVRTDAETLDAHGHDQWVMSILRNMEKRAVRADAVLAPRSTAEVAAILEIADRRRVPVVPFGAGSGVCGGAIGPAGGWVVDLRSLSEILGLDTQSQLVTCQPGVMGPALERWLRERGFTLGHFPQSFDISSVGGWVSTRAIGQYSTKYGGMEDMLLAFEAVLPGGRVVRTRPVPRAAAGPDLRSLVLGAEGSLAILTEATLRVQRRAEAEARSAFSFPDLASGLDTLRELVQAGWRPAVLRLYDATESARNFAGAAPDGSALLLFLTEGPQALVDAELAAFRAIAARGGGEDRGDGAIETWMEHRNQVPSFESFLERGILVDTIEVAAGWSQIGELYRAVCTAMQAVDGLLVVSAHSSHSYTQGTNLYFSFAARPAAMSDAEPLYSRCWKAAMEATLACGGTISHHHGIGRLRARWMTGELGTAYDVLVTLKRAFDPNGIMNPGALLEV